MKNITFIVVFIFCISNAKGQNPLKLKQFPPLKFDNKFPYKFPSLDTINVTTTVKSGLNFEYLNVKPLNTSFIPNYTPLNYTECKILVYKPTQNINNTRNHMPNALKVDSFGY